MLHHWNGQTWSASRTGAAAGVTLISGSGAGDVWLGENSRHDPAPAALS